MGQFNFLPFFYSLTLAIYSHHSYHFIEIMVRNTKMSRIDSCSLESLESTRGDKTHRNNYNATKTVIRAIIEV